MTQHSIIGVRTKSAAVLDATKALTATVKNTKAPDEAGAGEFEAIISTPTLDRDGEIWDEGWWDPLPSEIPIHVDHRFMDVGAVVARAVPFAEDGVLKVRGRYASTPKAQEIRTLVAEGMVTTMSIGAINAKMVDKDGVPHCTSAELLEASFVSVPANVDALVTSAKAGARNSSKDAERLQSIHDLAVANGATCEPAAADKTVTLEATVKSLDGSVEQYQDTLREALRDLHGGVRWLWLRGTFLTDGRVVYEVETETADGSYETATYQVTYTMADGAFSFDTPEEVDLAEVVVPAKNATTVMTAARPAPPGTGRTAAVTAVVKAEADAALAAVASLA